MTIVSNWHYFGTLGLAGLAAVWGAPSLAASCTVAAQSVSFGRYDPFEQADLDGAGNVHIDCDTVVNVSISLSQGGGDYSGRLMTSGPHQLAYNLFTSAQRIVVWGDGSGGSEAVSDSIQTADFAIYGAIPARQNIPAGSYTDVIYVTVTY